MSAAIKPLSLKEQLSRFSDECLDKKCAEIHLVKLADSLGTNWQFIAIDFGLTAAEIKDIEEVFARNPPRQRMEMFIRWQEKMNLQATYRYEVSV